MRDEDEVPEWARRSIEFWSTGSWRTTTWLGLPIQQLPQDLLALQQVIWEQRPSIIVETGLARGGSAVFYASMLELTGGRAVISVEITIDPEVRAHIERHPFGHRVTLIEGDSSAPEQFQRVLEELRGEKNVMVILDAAHGRDHVRRELEWYHRLVPAGGWLVVFDGIMHHIALAGIAPGFGEEPGWLDDNPLPAIDEFLAKHPEFEIDDRNTDLGATFAPNGFLKRHPGPR